MGILNVTPDSFSDGGDYLNLAQALKQALKMQEEGADLIDIGGESSRPGAQSISLEEELNRTIPVIKTLQENHPKIKLSIDTVKPEVMRQAIKHGVSLINDISGFSNPQSIEAVKSHQNINICLMHMQGTPQTMQQNPTYDNVVTDIENFFKNRIQQLKQQGIKPQRIYLDPGFGFGKTLEHNLILFKNIHRFKTLADKLGCLGLLIGVSRKGFIGHISGVSDVKEAKNRQIGNVIAAALSVQNGADIVRVHDVKETKQALMTAQALTAGYVM